MCICVHSPHKGWRSTQGLGLCPELFFGDVRFTLYWHVSEGLFLFAFRDADQKKGMSPAPIRVVIYSTHHPTAVK